MKKITFTIISILSIQFLMAQDAAVTNLKKDAEKTIKKDPKDTLQTVWKKGGTFNLNINQGSLSNW